MRLTRLQEKQKLAQGILYSLLLFFCIYSTSVTIAYAHNNSLVNDYNCELNLTDDSHSPSTIENAPPFLASIQVYIPRENSEHFQQKITRKSLSNRDPPLFSTC
ncbi:MAG: hypothetical protein COA59_11745 [Colwellia sp.]|jgi:hypothetical protein|nr:MAG: hypothetical protein COA59_11745 [Colwellia sp.]